MDMANADELGDIPQRLEQCYEEREQSAIIAITFAGMALEAFLYDYAAERLGDTFVAQHLDKLDLPVEISCVSTPDLWEVPR